MIKPVFDHDFSRVTREHYITGKAAVNFPTPGVTTGGWHFMSYWNRDSGVCKVSLAGIHFPETTSFFGDDGIVDVTQVLSERGWHAKGKVIWMADHFRAAADMVVRWAMSESRHCNVDMDDWFPAEEDRLRFLNLLATALPELQALGQSEKVERWLLSQ
ncbi:hypothetical protein KC131_26785 [Pseudomonas sp. JQ170]|uniref:hypothetical protein n=1 Tax=unclassified Pseudomonas TaxID=196821 RepID=UPI000FB0483C|nr:MULTISPECIES: hypothetical protein [unclassified Pseudomonas]MDN7144258.1 hypothetical protein [Pseudomonas sp. JQ170]WRO78201.1 hypothetical protein U9R80_11190 [Pseudomonas sp. 170C]